MTVAPIPPAITDPADSVQGFLAAVSGTRPLCNWIRALLEPVRQKLARLGHGEIRLTILIDARNVSVTPGPITKG